MTQQTHFWVFIWKNPKHCFKEMYACLRSLQHYLQWPSMEAAIVSLIDRIKKGGTHMQWRNEFIDKKHQENCNSPKLTGSLHLLKIGPLHHVSVFRKPFYNFVCV